MEDTKTTGDDDFRQAMEMMATYLEKSGKINAKIQQDYLDHVIKERDRALATLYLIRDRVMCAMHGYHMPTPRCILELLWPDHSDIDEVVANTDLWKR